MRSTLLLQPTWNTSCMKSGIVLWIGDEVIWKTRDSSMGS